MAEEKLKINNDQVKISKDGELTIKDAAVIAKLKEHGVTDTHDLTKPARIVGVIIG
jgi:hypothetical protein